MDAGGRGPRERQPGEAAPGEDSRVASGRTGASTARACASFQVPVDHHGELDLSVRRATGGQLPAPTSPPHPLRATRTDVSGKTESAQGAGLAPRGDRPRSRVYL